MLSRFLSFEKPFGPALIQVIFYLWVVYLLWTGAEQLWDWITYFDNDFWDALWGVIRTPFVVIFKILISRATAEVAIAILRIDKSTHDQVTGRAAPPKVD
ncbi:MAG: DUF4282 domain-containing protein [Pseudomonadota bacterium]